MKRIKVTLRIALIVVFLLSLGVFSVQPAQAATTIMYITPTGLTSGACDTWANACNLQYGLTSAATDSELWVKAGTYYPTTTADQTISFQLKNGVAIYGGFAGTENLLSNRNPAANLTILSGDIGLNDLASPITTVNQIVPGNSYHVVNASGTDATAILDGFTITAGTASGATINGLGAGMYNDFGSPTLTKVSFFGNVATQGGGMYNNNANPSLNTVKFYYNYSTDGAGLYNLSSNPTLLNITFNSNKATTGGGIYNNVSSPSLTNATFTTNSAGTGGGMYNQNNSNPTLTNVDFNLNGNATGGSGSRGGGIYNYVSNPTLNNVTFRSNTVDQHGGGMYNDTSNPTLTNVTFSNNSGGFGGGMYGWNSSPNLNHVTFSDNTATAFMGGAIANFGNTANTPIIKNSIVWSNNPTSDQIYDNGSTPVVNYSVVENGYTGTGNLSTNPLLNPLANNGGFTQTFEIGAGSSAIDTADITSCAATDQRGFPRPQGGGCDMGAFEVQQATPTPTLTAPATVTKTRTITSTPTISKTPTITATSPITSTPTMTSTPTLTKTTTITSTPVISVTPTATLTSVPGADFVGVPTSGSAPLTVQFTALNNSILNSCTWTFGDGATQTFTPPIGQSSFSVCPSTNHIYAAAGTYTVSLSVTKVTGASNSMTKTNYIQVNPAVITATVTLTPGITNTPTITATRTKTPTRTPTKALITKTFNSVGLHDGWILESGENTGTGGTLDRSATTFKLGDDAAKRQYRAILSFDTTSLPDTAIIQSAVIKIKHVGAVTGTNPFNVLGTLWIDIRKNSFTSALQLQLGDFKSAGSAGKVGTVPNTPALSWYTGTLNSIGRSNLNKLGFTQFRLYFNLDDNNNQIADSTQFLSGDSTVDKPVLVITYTMP